jgi:hypothetical protein
VQQVRQRAADHDSSLAAWHFGCNLQQRRQLVSCAGWLRTLRIVVVLMFLAGFAALAVTHSRLPALDVVPRPAHADLPPLPQPPLANRINDFGESDAALDLYGNEVMPAVATYTFDDLGSLYEVHSPQTEVPRLGSPQG